MSEDMHQISCADMNALFDGMQTAANQVQDGYRTTMQAFNAFANDNRRADGHQQAFQPETAFYGTYQQPQQPIQYGYGYTETMTNTVPYGMGMFGQLPTQPPMYPQQQQNTAYYGFYNQSYGK